MLDIDSKILGMPEKELVHWVRLIRTERVGPVNFFKLVNMFGSVEAAVSELPRRFGDSIKIYNANKALDDIDMMKRAGVTCISINSTYYPALLRTINSPPPLLFLKGHLSLCTKTAIGIVGTRNASLNGIEQAGVFARELGNHGFLIISGMAKGIDTAAHNASLEKGTMAVLGCGADIVYPKENQDLYEKICENGVILTEEFIGVGPVASNFPKRNRIIAGIARGLLVVEADIKSGSMITANYAADYGREVFAVPGSPTSTRSSGCNKLLKEGANMAESFDDIVKILKPERITLKQKPNRFTEPHNNDEYLGVDFTNAEKLKIEKEIIAMLDTTPIAIDSVIRALSSRYPNKVISAVITIMQIEDKIKTHEDETLISL